MRMMVTVRVPAEAGSRAIKDGSMPKIIQDCMERAKPEGAWFFLEDGKRTMRCVFDLKNPADMVPTFEPAIIGLGAAVEMIPVMTADELNSGFAAMR